MEESEMRELTGAGSMHNENESSTNDQTTEAIPDGPSPPQSEQSSSVEAIATTFEDTANGQTATNSNSNGGEVPHDTENENPSETPESSKKHHVSGDDLYRRSSQYQTWSFSSTELHEQKQQANDKGRQAALKLFESTRESMRAEKPELFTTYGNQLTSDILELISYDEEQKYLHFFCQQIVQICSHFKMPTQVKATAISFFRKFYLVNSVMEFRPRNILYTAVFLAAKSENYFISIETFCSRLPKTKPEDILGLEFIILSALKFTLLVHHAFRPLYGFFLDFQSLLLHPSPAMYDVNVDTIGQLYDKAKRWLNDYALLSDAPFLFTPPQIALAALYDCDKRITDRYLRIKFLKDPESKEGSEKGHLELLVKTIKRCIKVAKEETHTSREESTKIDEKCFFALNPSKLLKRRAKALQES